MRKVTVIGFLLFLGVTATAGQATYSVGSVDMGYQPKYFLMDRLPSISEFNDYVFSASELVGNKLTELNPKKAQSGTVIVSILPNGKMCFWTLFGAKKKPLKEEAELIDSLKTIAAPRVVGGPIVIGLKANALGEPLAERVLSVPEEWKRIGKEVGAGAGDQLIDRIIERACPVSPST